MDKIRIKLKEPLIRSHDGHKIDVSQKAFEKDPDKIYTVFASPGWLNECFHEKGKAILISRVENEREIKKAEKTPVKKEAK